MSPLERWRGREKNELVDYPFKPRKANVTSGGNSMTGLKLTLRPIVIQVFRFGLVLGFGPNLLRMKKSQWSENRRASDNDVHRSALPLIVTHLVENVNHNDHNC